MTTASKKRIGDDAYGTLHQKTLGRQEENMTYN